MAIEEGVDYIYLSGEVFQPNLPFSKKEIKDLTSQKGQSKIYLGLPTMMYEDDFARYQHLLTDQDLGIDGLLVTNLGSMHKFGSLGYSMRGDHGLNIYNAIAANFYQQLGLSTGTISNESPVKNTKELVTQTQLPMEMVVHGSPVVMYMSHDLYENTKVMAPSEQKGRQYQDARPLLLIDDKNNEHPVYRDNKGNNHMLLSKELCYLPLLKSLHELGVKTFRIEGCHYELETLRMIVQTYKKAITNLEECQNLFESLNYDHLGFTLGALNFN